MVYTVKFTKMIEGTEALVEPGDQLVDYPAPAEYVASMDIFVLSKKWLAEKVSQHIARNLYHMDRDLVMGQWQKGEITVNVFPFEGVALYNETVVDYFNNNMALITREIRNDLFSANHPIFTKVRDRVPTYYDENCSVDDCIVADGCVISGNVKHTVLFRQVTVEEDAQVENCIVMNDAKIGQGAQLKYVILDKDVTVTPGAKLIGTPNNPIIIKRGETV